MASDNAALAAIDAARSQLGVPYHWAWEKPGVGFDCSGLTQWAYAQAGVKLPRVTTAQVLTGTKVAKADLQPGDLVFPNAPIHHVQIYTGNGMIIEAPETGKNVREVPMWGFFTARRVAPGGTVAQGFSPGLGGGILDGGAAGPLGNALGLGNIVDKFMADARHWAIRVFEVLIGGALIIVALDKIGAVPNVGKYAKYVK